MPVPDRSESIRKAVEQARLELGIKGSSTSPRKAVARKSSVPTDRSPIPSTSNHDEINEIIESSKDISLGLSAVDLKLGDSDNDERFDVDDDLLSPPSEYEEPDRHASYEIERAALGNSFDDRSLSNGSSHSIFSVVKRGEMDMRYDVWVRYNCSWEEIQEAIKNKMKLLNKSSVQQVVLVDGMGDVLSPTVTTASKFFKIFSNYEEGMRFVVDIDEEQEAKLRADRDLAEFRALALKLTFRNSTNGDQHAVYLERNAVWDALTAAISKEFDNVEPRWIKHIIVEDADGDEVTPPLNTSEKFWRFGRSASMHNGDVFVFTLDEKVMKKDFEKREYEAFVANCVQVRWKVVHPATDDARECIALIPRGVDWDEIRTHFAKSNPEMVKFSDWISRLVLVDSDGDDLSPPIDGELIFWKVMNTYDGEARMRFEVTLDVSKMRDYEEELALEEFRKASKHFRVCLANHKDAELTDIYVPHNCNWQELTEGVAAFLKLVDPTWIDYFILLDTEGDPLSPPLNTADKFWKLGQKLTATNSLALYVHLKEEASKKLKEEEFIANACPFRVILHADDSRKGYVHVSPDSGWEDICRRVADALLLESPDWLSHFILVDGVDGDVLSPALKSAEKFWRFYKKNNDTSTFLVYRDEALVARAIAEKAQKDEMDRARRAELEAAALANKREYRCRLIDSSDDNAPGAEEDVFTIHVDNQCGWTDLLNAIGATNVVETDFIDHLRLVDSKGIVISVPIKNSKMFWKFASTVDKAHKSVFDIHVNHAYKSKIVKRRAEEALKRSMLLIHVSLASENSPDEALVPAKCSWETLTEVIASAFTSTKVQPEWISHIVLKDIDGDQLSPELDTAEKVWSTMPMYRIEESMVFIVSLDQQKIAESARLEEERIFRESTKHFKMRLEPIERLSSGVEVVMLPPNCMWQDIVQAVAKVFKLESTDWVEYLVLHDKDGDELSKHLDNMTLFWKTAGTYSFDDKKVFTVFLSMSEIQKTRAEQAQKAFMEAAEHIPLVLASNTRCTGTLHIMMNSKWEDICEMVLEELNLDQPKSVAKLHLVDEEFDELSPSIQTKEKFWKIYKQNYQAGAHMAFAVHTTNEPFSRLARAVAPAPAVATSHTSPTPVREVPMSAPARAPEWSQPAKVVSSVDRTYVQASPEMITAFHNGCENGDMEVVRKYIETIYVDPNVRNSNLSTAMHFACLKGNIEVVKYLYENKTDIVTANSAGLTPFDCACISGNLSLCEWIHSLKIINIAETPQADGQSTSTPPLHHAAMNARNEVVLWLILNKAELEAKGPFGTTALMEAAHVGHFNIVLTLCAAGADINACNDDGITAFHLACVEGHMDIVRYLSSKDIDINHPDNHGKTPFMYACSGGHLGVAKWLMQSGANHMLTGGCHDKLNTALHLAAQSGNMETVKWLVDTCHVNASARNEGGATPADFAFAAGHEEIAEFLNSTSAATRGGRFSVEKLERALEANDFVSAKKMLEMVIDGFSGDLELPYGTSPLHFVAASGHIELAQFLVMGGANVNALSDVGRTPMHYAAFKGRLDMAKYLFGVGANPNVQDQYGYSGYSIAVKNGDTALANWFASVATSSNFSPARSAAPPPSPSLFFGCVGPEQDSPAPMQDFSRGMSSDISVHRSPGPYRPAADDMSRASHPDSDKLHVACKAGDLNLAKTLIQDGAPINSKGDQDGPSPLHYAVMSGNMALVQFLLDKGAHLNDQNVKGSASFEVDSNEHEAMTPLHIACDSQNEAMVLFLIKKGADLNLKNKVSCMHKIVVYFVMACYFY